MYTFYLAPEFSLTYTHIIFQKKTLQTDNAVSNNSTNKNNNNNNGEWHIAIELLFLLLNSYAQKNPKQKGNVSVCVCTTPKL